jgi:putative hemolysin
MADFVERLELDSDEALANRSFSTVGGLILDQLGRIPDVGDVADWNGLSLEVVDMDGQRIDRVLVTRKQAEQGAG